MKSTFNTFLYGGDYNPNQWPKEIMTEDIRIFNKAHLNSATINVFSWAKIQPSETEYHFEELDEVIQRLSEANYEIVLATSTAALPAWMVKKYPEVARTDYEGRHHHFGQRHNACPNSLVYQKFAQNLVGKLVERYGDNPHIACWHVNNEYGGSCYCENCQKAFRVWLKEKYQTIAAVNEAWNTEFWGHTFYDWDEIVVPNALGEGIGKDHTAFAGLSIDYNRFNSDSLLNNFKLERDTIKKAQPQAIVTTNLMGTYKTLDYFKWGKEMDVISWDNYPSYNTPWSYVSMCHDLMRGLKQQPFMLMEQTPSQQNWQPYNSLKKPGQMRSQSYQTIAHGGDTIQFFQLRRSKGGCEKFHGAVIEHVGHENTRVFKEVAELGEELTRLKEVLGSENHNEVGVIFDWDNYWGLEYTSGPSQDLKYVNEIHKYYEYFYHENISCDLVETTGDFSKYKLLVAPVLYMIKPGVKEKLTEFVKNGGILFTTYMSGIVNESDNVYLGGYPGPLRELAGIWVEEIDALAPEETNQLIFATGETGTGNLVADIIHLEGAESIGQYASNFYQKTPFATKNQYGKGSCFYLGTSLDENGKGILLKEVVKTAKLSQLPFGKTPLEITKRSSETADYYFIMNFTKENQSLPEFFVGEKDLLKGKVLEEKMVLAPFATLLVKKAK